MYTTHMSHKYTWSVCLRHYMTSFHTYITTGHPVGINMEGCTFYALNGWRLELTRFTNMKPDQHTSSMYLYAGITPDTTYILQRSYNIGPGISVEQVCVLNV